VDTDALTSPFEADMAWVARLDKPDFVGKAALARAAAGPDSREKLVGFIMQNGAVPDDGSPVLVGGKLAGRVTSSRYSPLNQKAIGLAWVPAGHAAEDAEIEIRVKGQPMPAIVKQAAFYDSEGARLRQ
jgi:glycine cleavage system aminomethyltransferase T